MRQLSLHVWESCRILNSLNSYLYISVEHVVFVPHHAHSLCTRCYQVSCTGYNFHGAISDIFCTGPNLLFSLLKNNFPNIRHSCLGHQLAQLTHHSFLGFQIRNFFFAIEVGVVKTSANCLRLEKFGVGIFGSGESS